MRVVSFLNYKGGVGRTTLAALAGKALCKAGKKVLLIDNDCVRNLSLIYEIREKQPTVKDIYLSSIGKGSEKLLYAIRSTSVPDLDIIPGTADLSNRHIKDTFHLQKCISYCRLERSYDYVIIDNPSGYDLLQETSAAASTDIVIPTDVSPFAIYAIKKTLGAIRRTNGILADSIKVVCNFYQATESHLKFLNMLQDEFPTNRVEKPIHFQPFLASWKTHDEFNTPISKSEALLHHINHILFGIEPPVEEIINEEGAIDTEKIPSKKQNAILIDSE